MPSPTTSPRPCRLGGTCKVGDDAPGDGWVFYDAGSPQPWGQYLQVASFGWFSPRPTDSFTADCSPSVPFDTQALNGLGDGLAATLAISKACPDLELIRSVRFYVPFEGNTAVYNWYLPNSNELELLITSDIGVRRHDDTYWSSTGTGGAEGTTLRTATWWPGLANDPEGLESGSLVGTMEAFAVPIRAFGPRSTGSATTVPSTAVPSTTSALTTTPATAPPATTRPTTPAVPRISAAPGSHDFGTVNYTSSAEFTFTITNVGGGSLAFTSFNYADGSQFFYTIANNCLGKSLAAGATCTIGIMVYRSGDVSVPSGHHADTMNVVSNGGTATLGLSYDGPTE